jgi:hypothetical protein
MKSLDYQRDLFMALKLHVDRAFAKEGYPMESKTFDRVHAILTNPVNIWSGALILVLLALTFSN